MAARINPPFPRTSNAWTATASSSSGCLPGLAAMPNAAERSSGGLGGDGRHQGWNSHPGFFADDRLEQLLARIGLATTTRALSWRAGGSDWPRRVLHVLTEASAIGGHTRLCGAGSRLIAGAVTALC